MAAWELKRDHLTRYCLFGIDGADDIDMLPTSSRCGSEDLRFSTTCSINSIARAVDGKTYILNGEDQWVEYKRSGSGSGGGGEGEIPDAEEISDDDLERLFD